MLFLVKEIKTISFPKNIILQKYTLKVVIMYFYKRFVVDLCSPFQDEDIKIIAVKIYVYKCATKW